MFNAGAVMSNDKGQEGELDDIHEVWIRSAK